MESGLFGFLQRNASCGVTVIFISFILLMISACNRQDFSTTSVKPVYAQEVKLTPFLFNESFTGTVCARYETDMSFQVSGKTISRDVEVGQTVKKGDIIARIDPTDFILEEKAAKEDLIAAETDAIQLASDEARFRQLKNDGVMNQSDYERQKAKAGIAEARADRARHALVMAQNRIGYASLRASENGIVTGINYEAGQVVAAGQPVMRIARIGEKEIEVYIPESFIAMLNNFEAKGSLWSVPGKVFNIKLREISPIAEPVNRSYRARFSITDSKNNAMLGMTASVTLFIKSGQQIALLPVSALYKTDNQPAVWIIDQKKGSVALKPVHIAQYRQDSVAIDSGLKDGELVVTMGVHKLSPGMKVRVYGTDL